jgi:hypothetical protein
VVVSAPRPRRARSVTASLAAIILATEFLVVVLAALVVFGLGSVPPAVALGGGGALLVLIGVAALLLASPRGTRIGLVLGWIVQVALVASIALEVAVGLVGIVFAGLWTYSIIVGRRIDRRTA